MGGLTNLRKLKLHSNALTFLPPSIFGWTALQDLWLFPALACGGLRETQQSHCQVSTHLVPGVALHALQDTSEPDRKPPRGHRPNVVTSKAVHAPK